MDFMLGFPKGRKGDDVIWVIVDRLTKSILFLPIKMIDLVDKFVKLSIVSNRDPKLTS